jgi:hypothetical protein
MSRSTSVDPLVRAVKRHRRHIVDQLGMSERSVRNLLALNIGDGLNNDVELLRDLSQVLSDIADYHEARAAQPSPGGLGQDGSAVSHGANTSAAVPA